MLADYHIHVIAHGEYNYSLTWLQAYLDRAKAAGLSEIGFLEHDEYIDRIDTGMLIQAAEKNPDLNIRLGLEVDFIPGREAVIEQLVSRIPFDYIMGSVHFIDGWGFDHPDFRYLFDSKDLYGVYRDYYALVSQAVRSGLFDILGHLDLVKIWGYKLTPEQNIILAEPALRCIKAAGTVIEINSSGLRKPVAEMYPASDLLQRMFELDIPICMGSDAHHPEQTGIYLPEARQAARQAGYRYITGFRRRKRNLLPL